MVRRWTYSYVKENTRESSRRTQVIRNSSGFRYYLLLPLAPVLIYWGILWIAGILASAGLSFAQALKPQRKSS